jgi:putative ATP-dependent endonuclease of OLD family
LLAKGDGLSAALNDGFDSLFKNDPEVAQVTQTLKQLGYDWDLVLKDELNNTYELLLRKDGRSFDITSASSGEKEIMNFILGTFALNVRNGLIIVDEPELHLHPKWQRTLYDVFQSLHKATGNQFVLATHSPAFITAETLGKLKRVSRIAGQSTVIPLDTAFEGKRRELLQMINSHNNEKLFFADKVVLVEGIQDRLVFERILADLSKNADGAKAVKGEIVEVLEVYGKGNFAKYRGLLEAIKVPSFVIADRDYADQIGTAEVKALFVEKLLQVTKNVVSSPKSEDRATLTEEIHKAVHSKDWSQVEKIWTYIVDRHRALREKLSNEEEAVFNDFLKQQRERGTYILSPGAIEHYLPDGWTSLDKTIELASASDFQGKMLQKPKEYKEISEICESILSAGKSM